MKILLINVTYGIGSTGKIVESLYNKYSEQGHDVRVIYGRHSNTKDPSIIKGCYEFESKIHHAFSRISGNLYGGMFLSTLRIKSYIKKMKPDVVHLHCLNGFFVNIYSLLKFLKKNNIRTVLTNHSEFMYTANCGYALDCEKWKTGQCKKCQNVKSFNGSLSLNRTHHFFNKMKRAFNGFENLTITNVSPWLNNRSASSEILESFNNESILNPVSDSFFKNNVDNPYIKLGLNEHTKKVLYVTPNFNEKEKGGYLLETIAKKYENKDVKFILISSVKEGINIEAKNIIVIKEKLSQAELSGFYKFADCSIILSERETFSMVVAESLSCGTPVVGFKAGGPETICIDKYAKFVDQKDINSFVEELNKMLDLSANKNEISELAYEKYSEEKISENYIENYKKVSKYTIKNKKFNNLFIPISFLAYYTCLVLTSIIPALYGATQIGTIVRFSLLGIFSLIVLIYSIKSKANLRPLSKLFLSLIFVGSLIVTIITYINPQIGSATVDVSIKNTLKNICYPIAIGIQLLATFDLLPKELSNRKSLEKTLLILTALTLAFAVYAGIDQFVTVYSPGGGYVSNPHRNLNGFILFIGFINALYLVILTNKNKRTFAIVSVVLIYAVIWLTLCKGAIVFSSLLLALLFFYNFKKHLKLNIAIVSVVSLICISFVIVMEIKELRTNNVINTIYESFYHQFYKSMAERVSDLSKASPLFADWRIIFGYGDGYWATLPKDIADMNTTDCAYFITLLTSGFIGLLYYICLLTGAAINSISLFRRNKKLGLISIGITVSFLIYGFYIGDGIISLNLFGLAIEFCTYSLTKALLIYYKNSNPKRVLHVVECLGKGGTEAFIYNYNKELVKEGYEIDVYCLGKIDEEQQSKFEDAGMVIYQGSLPSIRNYPKSSLLFDLFLNSNDYSIVHCDANFDSALYLRISSYYGVKTRIFHSHDTLTGIKFGLKDRLLYSIKRFSAIKNATDYCACSKQAGCDIIGKKFFGVNGNVIPNIIDFDKYANVGENEIEQIKGQYNINENDFVIGNISRFEPKKNQEFIVRVFSSLVKEKPNAILVLGGVDGGQEHEIKELVKKLKLENSVRFIGPRNDVPVWLHVFDVYLFPSLFEGLGIVCLENQSAGLSTIASINVPTTTDLGLGLIEFLPIDSNDVSMWVNQIIDKKENIVKQSTIKQALIEKGFASIEEIKKIYE